MPKATRQKTSKARAKPAAKSKLSGMFSDSNTLDEWEMSPLKVSMYGKSGTGKTTLASTFPGKILWLLCSGGKGTNELASVPKEARDKVVPYTLAECDEIIEICRDDSIDQFSTIVLDHTDGLQNMRLAEILGLDEPILQNEWGLATMQQYGERSLNLKTYFRAMLDLRKHNVIFISQEKMVENDSEDELDAELDIVPSIGPALSPSVLSWFNPAVDYTVRTFIKPKTKKRKIKVGGKVVIREEKVKGEYEYCLMTGPHSVYTTKFRVPRGTNKPLFLIDPNYDKLVKLIQGE